MFCFIHIPKNAGCSITQNLMKFLDKNDIQTDPFLIKSTKAQFFNPPRGKRIAISPSHMTMLELQNVMKLDYKKYFKFVVRTHAKKGKNNTFKTNFHIQQFLFC